MNGSLAASPLRFRARERPAPRTYQLELTLDAELDSRWRSQARPRRNVCVRLPCSIQGEFEQDWPNHFVDGDTRDRKRPKTFTEFRESSRDHDAEPQRQPSLRDQ